MVVFGGGGMLGGVGTSVVCWGNGVRWVVVCWVGFSRGVFLAVFYRKQIPFYFVFSFFFSLLLFLFFCLVSLHDVHEHVRVYSHHIHGAPASVSQRGGRHFLAFFYGLSFRLFSRFLLRLGGLAPQHIV